MKRALKVVAVIAALLVISFVIFRTPDTDPDEMRAKYGGEPSQFAELPDGTLMHYRDEGPRDALPIVLHHGSNADLHTWTPWVERLSDDYRIIRLDAIGHGLTGVTGSGGFSRAEMAADIAELAQELQLERFIVGGNSMGGAIALEYALLQPEKVAGIVLVDSGGGPVRRTDSGSGNIGFTLMRIPGIRSLAMQITPRDIIADSFSQSVSNKDIVTAAAVDRYWELLRYPGNREATLERFSSTYVPFTAEDLAPIEAPTLILWGDEDPITLPGNAPWFSETIKETQLITYPGVGHLPHEEVAEQSAQDLKEWLVSTTLSTEDGD